MGEGVREKESCKQVSAQEICVDGKKRSRKGRLFDGYLLKGRGWTDVGSLARGGQFKNATKASEGRRREVPRESRIRKGNKREMSREAEMRNGASKWK